MANTDAPLASHKVATQEEWIAARTALLEKEKALTRARDELAAERRKLPWVKVEKPYVFDTPEGPKTLADLFRGRSQLIVKHFMLGPGWKEGCVGCSFEMDHIEGALIHIENHDVSLVAVSRAPLGEIAAFKARMGWQFRWVSSAGSDFNYDFHVSFTPEDMAAGRTRYNYRTQPVPIEELSGLSVFYKDEAGDIYHTYSAYARGAEEVLTSYMLLDLTPKGRNEAGPNHDLTDWVRHHDRYDAGGHVAPTGRYVPADGEAGCCSESSGSG
ncbi:MAG: DUF899 domain-containing protein [Dichotomicrobium sp.]